MRRAAGSPSFAEDGLYLQAAVARTEAFEAHRRAADVSDGADHAHKQRRASPAVRKEAPGVRRSGRAEGGQSGPRSAGFCLPGWWTSRQRCDNAVTVCLFLGTARKRLKPSGAGLARPRGRRRRSARRRPTTEELVPRLHSSRGAAASFCAAARQVILVRGQIPSKPLVVAAEARAYGRGGGGRGFIQRTDVNCPSSPTILPVQPPRRAWTSTVNEPFRADRICCRERVRWHKGSARNDSHAPETQRHGVRQQMPELKSRPSGP